MQISSSTWRGAAALIFTLAPAVPALAQCPPDAYEPNEDCAQAAVFPANQLVDLSIGGSQAPGGVQPDFFVVTVPAGRTLEVVADSFTAHGILVRVYDAPTCTQPVATGGLFPNTARATNASAAPADFWIEVTQDPNGLPFGCEGYWMSVYVFLDVCASLAPDAFEPNDTIGSAAPLPPGVHPGLNLHGGSSDFYLIPAAPGDVVELTTTQLLLGYPAATPTVLFVDAVTGAPLQSAPANGTTTYTNTTPHAQVGLRLILSGDGLCCEYDLEVDVSPAACSGLVPDWLEDNEPCLERVTIPPRFYPDLNMTYTDPDYYRVRLFPGQTMVVIVDYDPGPASGVAMQVWEACEINAWHIVHSLPGRETCVLRNDGPEHIGFTLAIRVDGQQFDPLAPCAEYDLTLWRYDAPTGTNYCDAAQNSSGQAGLLQAYGSAVVDDGELALYATGIPQWAPGLFFFGPTQAQVPFGDGLRCVGGALLRLGPVNFAGQQARLFGVFDLDEAPLAGLVVPGSTWRFQCWFRDGATSNFTDAVTIDFQ